MTKVIHSQEMFFPLIYILEQFHYSNNSLSDMYTKKWPLNFEMKFTII